jgi:hypothetical protein
LIDSTNELSSGGLIKTLTVTAVFSYTDSVLSRSMKERCLSQKEKKGEEDK